MARIYTHIHTTLIIPHPKKHIEKNKSLVSILCKEMINYNSRSGGGCVNVLSHKFSISQLEKSKMTMNAWFNQVKKVIIYR